MLNRFILFFFLCSSLSLFSQSVNGGFEQGFSDGTTLGWSTPDIAGANTTNDALSGKKAAKAWVFNYYKLGSWVSLTSADDFSPKNGGAVVLPTKLTGYYKYEGESAECDMADISLLIGKRNDLGKVDTLAFGATELKLSARYRYFEFPIFGDPGPEASFVSVNFSPAGRCNNHGGSNCCFLFVDDLQMLPDPNGDEVVAEVPKTELVVPKDATPKGKVLGRKARGIKARKERKERRQRMKNAFSSPQRSAPAPQRPAEQEKPKPAKEKAAPEVEEEAIPAEIQKEIDRIRKVQDEEEDKRLNGDGVTEEESPEENEVAPESEEEPIESGWETDESSEDEATDDDGEE